MDNTTADFKSRHRNQSCLDNVWREKTKIALLSARVYRLSYIQNLVLNALLFKSKIVMNRIMSMSASMYLNTIERILLY